MAFPRNGTTTHQVHRTSLLIADRYCQPFFQRNATVAPLVSRLKGQTVEISDFFEIYIAIFIGINLGETAMTALLLGKIVRRNPSAILILSQSARLLTIHSIE